MPKYHPFSLPLTEGIGFIWNPGKAAFINQFNSLERFSKENGRFPSQQSIDLEEEKLYNFIRSVRFKYLEGKLEKYKIKMLTQFQFLFHRDEIWEYKYKTVKEWINYNGKFPKCNNSKKEEKILYCWLKNQSENYLNNKLNREQKLKFNKINIKDFIENNKKIESPKTIEEMIGRLTIYFDKYGKLPVYSEKAQSSYLATHCTKLRKIFKQKKLTNEHISALVKMNFKFDIIKSNENKFNMELLKLAKFRIENPHSWPKTGSEDNDEKKLAYWLNNQRTSYNKGKLSVERVLKLEEMELSL